ncbi:F-box domain-containing protein [Caenorhabditis elegans]|uniref:F-box domain-containing protein n=1 Tax=Caenorhabditis elegans TaxID=6239 RepID=Q95Q44_CAEEL|nr:F-box domain-containing protein [Caenorhabditis elegans]CCD67791.1 F-box domain-containing protein [Caenorhabditis elegans]|eukprot:NP_491238.1 Uncharacterized protein CELE_T03F1.6 [Caenorhabditis elegans]
MIPPTTNSLGIFGELPVDLLSSVCRHLPMVDVVTVSMLDSRLGGFVERIIYREIKALRVEVHDNDYSVYFINKDSRVTNLNLTGCDWEDVIKYGTCIEKLELNICPGKSTSQLFQTIKRASFTLRSLKINVLAGADKCVQKMKNLEKRCFDLVSRHSSSLRHLELSTSDEQHVYADLNIATSSMRLTYHQPAEPKPSEQTRHGQNHSFMYIMFHDYLNHHTISNVTLEIASKYDANLALQKAYQAALPHSRRRFLESLTIEFGNSLKAVTEEEMKRVLLCHVDEFHHTTPNLQHFHCSLPHDENFQIDLSQEFLALLNEPVRKTRQSKSSCPYNSTISLRAVRCQ